MRSYLLVVMGVFFSSVAFATPQPFTRPARLQSAVSATLRGSVDLEHDAPVGFVSYFEYGTSTEYGSTVFATLPGYTEARVATEPNTTYHFRLVLEHLTGFAYTVYGKDATFTTPDNFPPTANDASANISDLSSVDVVCDFTDPESGPVTLTNFTQPQHGGVFLRSTVPTAIFTYVPNATFPGKDSFTYTVADDHGATATATVRLSNYRRAAAGKYKTTIITKSGQRSRPPMGTLSLDLMQTGRFTGVVRWLDQRFPIVGRFSRDGFLELKIDRARVPLMILKLKESETAAGLSIGGDIQVLGTNFTINDDTRLVFPTDAPQKGFYTVSLANDRDDTPQGNGYVIGKVRPHGAMSFVGRTGEGQAFSFSSQLRRGFSAQFYVTVGVEPRDRLSGLLQFPSGASGEADGNVVWFKPPGSQGRFSDGFTAELSVVGSRFAARSNQPILQYADEAIRLDLNITYHLDLRLFDGLLTGASEDSLKFEPSPASSREPNAAAVEFKLDRATGIFTGSFPDPWGRGAPHSFSGVFLQQQNYGSGLVVDGAFAITVKPR